MHALSQSGSFRSKSILARRLSAAESPRGRDSPDFSHDSFDHDGSRTSSDIPPSGIISHQSGTASPEVFGGVPQARIPRVGKSPTSVNGKTDHHAGPGNGATETTSLLASSRAGDRKPYGTTSDVECQTEQRVKPSKFWQRASETAHEAAEFLQRARNPKTWDRKAIFRAGVVDPVKSLPAVFLGLLLNVLDGLSYGEYTLNYLHNLASFLKYCWFPYIFKISISRYI